MLIVVFRNKQLTIFRYGNPLTVPLAGKHGPSRPPRLGRQGKGMIAAGDALFQKYAAHKPGEPPHSQ